MRSVGFLLLSWDTSKFAATGWYFYRPTSPVNTPYIPIKPCECSLPSRSADRPHMQDYLQRIPHERSSADSLSRQGACKTIIFVSLWLWTQEAVITPIIATWRKEDLRPTPNPLQRLSVSSQFFIRCHLNYRGSSHWSSNKLIFFVLWVKIFQQCGR